VSIILNNCLIQPLSSNENKKWDEYVKAHADGSFFHLSGWIDVMQRSFSHSCHYLAAYFDGNIVGVLPLVEVKSKLFGYALVSTPFCVYGGAIADDSATVRALEAYACELAEQLNVDYLELRYKEKQESTMLLKSVHSTFSCELAEDDVAILANVKKKQRAVIRHSLKNDLTSSSSKNIEPFYNLLSQSYRNLGTPMISKRYFEHLIDIFKDDIDITLVKDNDGKPSVAVMNFYFNEQVLPYYGGGNEASRFIKSADFMYYQVMCNAGAKGYSLFDFGRSKNDSGPYKYKKNWGMEPQPLHYYYHLVKATSLPNLSPNNPKYKFFISMWQKLPLKLSQLLGPFLSKYLG
jgi:FemAB-related protein (PEP-CTERM system-associated)